MSFSLYDAVIPSNLQILGAVDALITKAEAFCSEHDRAAADLIDARLAPDETDPKGCVVHGLEAAGPGAGQASGGQAGGGER